MSFVELIYESQCANVDRAQLLRAFSTLGIPPSWTEWTRGALGAPDYADNYGSPTILVDGHDVAPETEQGGACCRLYADQNGQLCGVPSVDAIVLALRASMTSRS
jgi:hypothetical protein